MDEVRGVEMERGGSYTQMEMDDIKCHSIGARRASKSKQIQSRTNLLISTQNKQPSTDLWRHKSDKVRGCNCYLLSKLAILTTYFLSE